jgi:hypothetical protein
MKALKDNPLLASAQSLCGRPGKWLERPGIYYIGLAVSLPACILFLFGICTCTLFFSVSLATILLSTLLIGTSAFSAISREREKKTLDSLRLTLLEPEDILVGKLYPEFMALCRLLLVLSPSVLILGGLSEYGLAGGFTVLLISLLAGGISLLGSFILSSACRNTSQAILWGLTIKILWLLATPLLDMVLAAIIVSRTPPPLFSSISPLAALYALVLPQAMTGAWVIVPWSYFFLAPLTLVALWFMARRLYREGGYAKAYSRRKESSLYATGWSPLSWLTGSMGIPHGLFASPVFLRELSLQVRNGAGKLPGFLVFVVLFLAPYFYARSWGIREYTHQGTAHIKGNGPPRAVTQDRGPSIFIGHDCKVPVIRTNSAYIALEHHTLKGCLRWTMYRAAGVPLPAHLLGLVHSFPDSGQQDSNSWCLFGPGDNRQMTNPSSLTAELTMKDARDELATPLDTRLSAQGERSVNTDAIRIGLIGAIWLLLIYLAIRGSCFTITAITGEKDRRSWEDMVLAGVSPEELLLGKLAGALVMPLIQMTIVFPMLYFFVITGNLKLVDILSLYLYAVTVTISSGLLGLWASASSATTHEAQGKALGLIFTFFVVLPLALPFIWILSVIALPFILVSCAFSVRRMLPWLAGTVSAALSPASAAPLLAPLFFISGLTPEHFFSLFMVPMVPSGFIAALAAIAVMTALSLMMYRRTALIIEVPGEKDALCAEMVPRDFFLAGSINSKSCAEVF